jgi:Protein of unknown function (DUF3105)
VRRPALLLGSLAAVVVGCGSGHRALPCNRLPGRAVPILKDIHHIAYVDAPHVPYDSVPPTSGPHVPFVVAPGPYGSPIPDALQVHDLEHGHVLIQYAPGTSGDERHELEDFARRYPRDVLVAPYPKLRSGVALTAWGRIERLSRPDGKRIRAFVTAFRGRYVHGWRGGAKPCTTYK